MHSFVCAFIVRTIPAHTHTRGLGLPIGRATRDILWSLLLFLSLSFSCFSTLNIELMSSSRYCGPPDVWPNQSFLCPPSKVATTKLGNYDSHREGGGEEGTKEWEANRSWGGEAWEEGMTENTMSGLREMPTGCVGLFSSPLTSPSSSCTDLTIHPRKLTWRGSHVRHGALSLLPPPLFPPPNPQGPSSSLYLLHPFTAA